MPSRSNLEKRLRKMEKNLTPEEIAKIGISIIDRAFDKEITTEEADEQLEELKKLYLDPMDYNAWVKFRLKLGEFEHCRWGYSYFKNVVECIDFKIAYFHMLLLLRESCKSHEDCIRALQDSIPEFKPLWKNIAKSTLRLNTMKNRIRSYHSV